MVGQSLTRAIAQSSMGEPGAGASPFPLPRGRKEVVSRHELRHVGRGHGCVPLGRRSSAAVAADFILEMISAGRFESRGERIQTVEATNEGSLLPILE